MPERFCIFLWIKQTGTGNRRNPDQDVSDIKPGIIAPAAARKEWFKLKLSARERGCS
jgi:hypothetical protein